MRTLFADQAQPFVAQADLIELGPLTDGAVAGLVEDGFARTGRRTTGVPSRLVAFAHGHPQRAMLLADALWRLTAPGAVADHARWEEALAAVRVSVDRGSERLYALLPSGHQRTLRVIAGGGSTYGTAADVLDLAPGTAAAAVEALVGNGAIARGTDAPEVVDPLFADWIRRRFPV